MPSKFVLRSFVENGYYHVFDRGNNKQTIFREIEDYFYFLKLLHYYLSEPGETLRVNFYQDICVLTYCLLPNHFHLMIKQTKERSISKFMQVILQRYTHYHNKKYAHVGHVFQGKYGARLLEDNNDLLNTSRYVHQNALDIGEDVLTYRFSSSQYYLNTMAHPQWLNTQILKDVMEGYFGVKKGGFETHYRRYLLD
ncbi:MAG: transposase [Candidatus Kerfeldbacteria bacterium]|nr:transposase [Candidatus Kerfeldbacteria bacterium]